MLPEFVEFYSPTRVVYGPGISSDFKAELDSLGIGKYLIVSDRIINNLGLTRNVLDISDHLTIRLVLALGKPAETIVLEDLEPGGDIRYWRDQKDIHHVPKRKLEELIIK